MLLARVIGRVVATQKDERLIGKKLLIIQPCNSDGEPISIDGKPSEPLVAVDSVGAGFGELVFWVKGKEAAFPFLPQEVPVDAGIVGIVDGSNKP